MISHDTMSEKPGAKKPADLKNKLPRDEAEKAKVRPKAARAKPRAPRPPVVRPRSGRSG